MDYLKIAGDPEFGRWIVVGLISHQKGDLTPWACARCINGGSGLCFTVHYTPITTTQPRLTVVRLQKGDKFLFVTVV